MHVLRVYTFFIIIIFFFFFNDTATTDIYTLSLHDALPICWFSDTDTQLHICEKGDVTRQIGTFETLIFLVLP